MRSNILTSFHYITLKNNLNINHQPDHNRYLAGKSLDMKFDINNIVLEQY
jgi:hypothetical protein